MQAKVCSGARSEGIIDMSEPAGRTTLRVFHWLPRATDVLGPGTRAVVWVQGCSLACKGCMVPETWPRSVGRDFDPVELGEQIASLADVEGLTVSGGEPTEQASAVADLLSVVRSAGKNTWLYTGHTLEELVARNDREVDRLLTNLDTLVDGRYEAAQAGTLPFKGSSNQRIIHFTDAFRGRMASLRPRTVEMSLDTDGQLVVVGVPPPGFLRRFREELEQRGVTFVPLAPWL